ncbi:hypothetical protein O9929_23620 [Vibrio lentus]|nr:hypothetical protein [Vibrio lentus]
MAAISLAYGMWSNGAIRSALFPEIPKRSPQAIELEDGAPLPFAASSFVAVSWR